MSRLIADSAPRYHACMADDRQQIMLRLPRELVARIDERRAAIGEQSRNAWIERVVEWGLSQPQTARPVGQPRTRLT
jgi:metal-responsive CopG/Arc/MetJ family transcriptional regulator